MELKTAIARRRMVRAFEPRPIGGDVLLSLLDSARRGPSAGNTQAVSFLVLDQPQAVAAYWDTTLTPERRASFRWQQLLDAPALILVATDPTAYVQRYAETDKAHPRLGQGLDQWSMPYWFVDAGAVVQNVLLLAVDAGLGACLFGLFQHETAVKDRFGVPDHIRLTGTIALGHPLPDEPGRSAGRNRPPISDITHFGGWGQP